MCFLSPAFAPRSLSKPLRPRRCLSPPPRPARTFSRAPGVAPSSPPRRSAALHPLLCRLHPTRATRSSTPRRETTPRPRGRAHLHPDHGLAQPRGRLGSYKPSPRLGCAFDHPRASAAPSRPLFLAVSGPSGGPSRPPPTRVGLSGLTRLRDLAPRGRPFPILRAGRRGSSADQSRLPPAARRPGLGPMIVLSSCGSRVRDPLACPPRAIGRVVPLTRARPPLDAAGACYGSRRPRGSLECERCPDSYLPPPPPDHAPDPGL